MKRIWKVLAFSSLIFGMADCVSGSMPSYEKPLPFPILGTKEYVFLYSDPKSDPDREHNGNWSVMQSVVCFRPFYSCDNISDDKDKSTDGSYSGLYSVGSSGLPDYPYTGEIKILLSPSKIIKAGTLYLSPRPETGLINWEVNLIDRYVRAFTGQAVNKNALKRCYLFKIDEGREECIVQKVAVNKIDYSITVAYLNLQHEVGKPWKPERRFNLRSFAVYIFPSGKSFQ